MFHNTQRWINGLIKQHVAFAPLAKVTPLVNYSYWPSIEDYNKYASEFFNANDQLIKFCCQPTNENQHYEEKIFTTGLVNTRLNNWHDFFNYCSWQAFPKTKSLINYFQYTDLKTQSFKLTRTKRQNHLAHFDECGVIILFSDDELMNMVKQHQWKTLFWDNRARVQSHMQFIVFGHAIYEKLISPYIGLTGKGIFIKVSDSSFAKKERLSLPCLDELLYQKLKDLPRETQDKLQPIPLLGIPGWSDNASNKKFYDDKNYFRDLRASK